MQSRLRGFVFIFLSLIVAPPCVVFAQEGAPAPLERGQMPVRLDPEKLLAHLSRALDLSADQQREIRPVLVERQKRLEGVLQDQSLSPHDRHARARAIRDESQARIDAFLNDQQRQKLSAITEQTRRSSGTGMGAASSEGTTEPQFTVYLQ
jgi:hypothetical protein